MFQQNGQGFRNLHELPTRSRRVFLEAEEERERREEERVEKRRKEDQEFFLKLMQALNK